LCSIGERFRWARAGWKQPLKFSHSGSTAKPGFFGLCKWQPWR
jgi:hypothetical protein